MTDMATVALVVALVWPPLVALLIEILRAMTEF